MEAWENAWPDSGRTIERIRAVHVKAELAGVDLMAQSRLADGLPGLVRAVETADDQLLCAAVRACTKGSGTLARLLLERAPYEPETVPRLMDDKMWDQWARLGGVAPIGVGGEAVIAISVVQYLVIPGWAEDLDRYQALMETLLLAPPPEHPTT